MTFSPRFVQKYLMRIWLRDIISQINPATQRRKSAKIVRTLMRNKSFKKAETIFTYLSVPGEVQTLEFAKRALALGKRIFVPRLKSGSKRFEICEIQNLRADLKKGRYGILEPKGKSGMPSQLELIITPGLAFDRHGNRLGRGLGYFDRFLEKAKDVPKIGLAFREQMVEKVPMETHDVAVDQVITD